MKHRSWKTQGLPGAVTIATNMAGRGTDIKLGPRVKESGGLHIVGTERHDSRRIDRQLRGRAGRQGDPGSSRFYLSLEDDLMRLFGNERIAGVMQRLGFQEGEAIEHTMITNSVERAQKKVEENNFAIRKRLLEYDNVMNQQREVIYEMRRQALMGERLKDEIFEMVEKSIESIIAKYDESADVQGLIDEVQRTFLIKLDITPEEYQKLGEVGLKDLIVKETREFYARKEERYGIELMSNVERFAMLTVIDDKWKEHLREMDDLKEGINFRAYAQKDPLIEYKMDGFKLFAEMLEQLYTDVINFIFKFTTQTAGGGDLPDRPKEVNTSRLRTSHAASTGMGFSSAPVQNEINEATPGKPEPVKVDKKIGRNDPCFCGSGKKYKHCHGKGK